MLDLIERGCRFLEKKGNGIGIFRRKKTKLKKKIKDKGQVIKVIVMGPQGRQFTFVETAKKRQIKHIKLDFFTQEKHWRAWILSLLKVGSTPKFSQYTY